MSMALETMKIANGEIFNTNTSISRTSLKIHVLEIQNSYKNPKKSNKLMPLYKNFNVNFFKK